MPIRFLDANIIIRFVTQDDSVLAKKVHAILQRVKDGAVLATTCESILSECVFVLSSKRLYHLPRPQVAELLKVILAFKGLKMAYKRVYRKALDLYATTMLDFPDALAVAHMQQQKITDIYSFDTDFDQITGIKRLDQ
jgi:uncharacterized protein